MSARDDRLPTARSQPPRGASSPPGDPTAPRSSRRAFVDSPVLALGLLLMMVLAGSALGVLPTHLAPRDPGAVAPSSLPSAGAALAAPQDPDHPLAPQVELDGMDVSSYQGTINWASVNSSGIQFAIAKAAEGTTCTDSDFVNNAVNGKAAGIYIGAYDFAELPGNTVDQYCPTSGTTDNATAEANYFDSIAGPYFTSGYIYPSLDLENGCSAEGQGDLSVKELSSWVGQWMAAVQSYILAKDNVTIDPLIYMSEGYAANCIEPWITQFPLWIAWWNAGPPSIGQYSNWAFWQYSDDCTTCGTVSGADADYFNGGVTYLLDHYVFGTAGPLPPSASYAMKDNNTGSSLSCGGTFAVGDQIEYTATATGGTAPYNYSWSFGDGTLGYGNPVSHEYTSAGTYDTTLVVTDSKGLNGTTGTGCSFTVTGSLLKATASATPTSGTAPLAVTFTGGASGGSGTYSSWYWSFGDGTPGSRSQSPSHTYASAGTYTATLTVNDSAGHTATASSPTVTVSSAAKLGASATDNLQSGVAPLAVSFTATASGGTGIYTFAWRFGDGGSSNQQDPSHTYTTSGVYTPSLTVNDSAGATATATASTITVSAAPPPALAVSAAANLTAGKAPLAVGFTGTASGGTPPYAFAWDFGDGGSASTAAATHLFTSACSCQVVLTVNDSAGHTAQAHLTINVSAGGTSSPLAVSLEASASSPLGDAISFQALATGGTGLYTSYSWSFGDGSGPTSTTAASTSYTYTQPGTYSVSVTVTDSSGSTATSTPILLTVVAPEYTVLAGTAVNASSSQPLAGVDLAFWDSGASGSLPSWTTSANGTYRVALAPGTVFVNASATGYQPLAQQITLPAGESETLNVALTPSHAPPASSSPGPTASNPPTYTNGGWWTSLSYPGLYVLVGVVVVAVGAAIAVAASRRRRPPLAETIAPGPPASAEFGPYGGGPAPPYDDAVAPSPGTWAPPPR